MKQRKLQKPLFSITALETHVLLFSNARNIFFGSFILLFVQKCVINDLTLNNILFFIFSIISCHFWSWNSYSFFNVCLDCSESLIFPYDRRGLCSTGGHLGFKFSEFRLGMSVKSSSGSGDGLEGGASLPYRYKPELPPSSRYIWNQDSRLCC